MIGRSDPGGAECCSPLCFIPDNGIEIAAGSSLLAGTPPLWLLYQSVNRRKPEGGLVAGKRKKFNRIPKTEDLIPQLREAGLGLNVLPTYLCLLDHTDSKGKCWPSINRMASILGLCRRTVERHMKLLCEAGLVLRNHQQRARRGRFSTRRYVVVAVLFFKKATVRHQGRSGKRSLYKERTKGSLNSQKSQESREERRQREAKRRREGYEWLFKTEE